MVLVLIPAVIIEVIAALAVLLMYWGTIQIVTPIMDALVRQVPVIGGYLADRVTDVVNAVHDEVAGWVEASATPFAHVLVIPALAGGPLLAAVVAVLAAIVGWVEAVNPSAIAGQIGQAVGGFTGQLAELRAQIEDEMRATFSALQHDIQIAGETALTLFDTMNAAIATAIDGARSEWTGLVGAAQASIEAELNALRGDVLARVAGIEAGIEVRIQQAVAGIDGFVQSVVAQLQDRVLGIEATVAQAIPGIEARVGAVEATDVAILAQVGVIADTLTREITDCIDPMCENLKPEIPNIRAALDILEAGLLAGLVADAIVDPRGAARHTDGLVTGPLNEVLSPLLGLAS